MKSRLAALLEEIPLPKGWKIDDVTTLAYPLAGLDEELCGIAAVNDSGTMAVGSALGDVALAYYELLERAHLQIAKANAPREYALFDRDRKPAGVIPATEIWPAPAADGSWRHAVSNGVASGRTWGEACARAAFELLERDRVLRAWIGAIGPKRVVLDGNGVPGGIKEAYGIEGYAFRGEQQVRGVSVAGIFAMPLRDDAPLVYGFGAAATLDAAVAKASRQTWQRLGFLWGEAIPENEPQAGAGPDFHQEYYLWRPGRVVLERWLHGEHVLPVTAVAPAPGLGDIGFVDLTPPDAKMVTVKAVAGQAVPLVFGRWDGYARLRGKELPGVHPIS